jgi:type 1 glutamine amidotransferase
LVPDGINARANVEWTVVHPTLPNGKEMPGNSQIDVYKKPGWAKEFDVVVHNECYAECADKEFVESIAKAHEEGVPGVVIHGTLHAYRSADKVTDEWRKFLGVTSTYHERGGVDLEVKTAKADHPVMMGIPAKWTIAKEELYVITKQWPNCVPLATVTAQGAKDKGTEQPVVWVNTHGKARVFGTSLGHPNTTFQDKNFLDVLAHGLLWACDKLDEKGQPKPGYGPKAK